MKVTLRAARREKELSQAEMAKHLLVHPNTYIRWEKDPAKISIQAQQNIVRVLKKKVEDIDWIGVK